MKLPHCVKQTVTSAIAVAILGLAAGSAFAEEYSFKIHNKTHTRIKKLLVSEDGKEYGFFDIGRGIAAGKRATLIWDKSTHNDACKQWVKAIYEDGEESEPAKFDFCETDLELIFE